MHREFRLAARAANNVGEFRNRIRERINGLADPTETTQQSPAQPAGGDGASQQDFFHVDPQDLQRKLEEEQRELDEATRGFDAVQFEDHDPAIGGTNEVGGSQATATVNRQLAINAKKLHETLLHEADPEVGHAGQAQPNVSRDDAALVIGGQTLSAVEALEGDVEGKVARKQGRDTNARDDQPEEVYGKGQRAMNAIAGLVGTQEVDSVLRKNGAEAGNFAHLQHVIWQEQLAIRTDVRVILDEAKETGYEKEAAEAIFVGKA